VSQFSWFGDISLDGPADGKQCLGLGPLRQSPFERFDQRIAFVHDFVLDLEDLLPLAPLLAFELLDLLLDGMLFFQRRGLAGLSPQRLDLLFGVGPAQWKSFSSVSWSKGVPVSSMPENSRYSSRW
jgi:hypothetical protein